MSASITSAASVPVQVAVRQAADILTDAERQPCEVWTRVMGYHRPTSSFNIGKRSEHRERRFFTEAAAKP